MSLPVPDVHIAKRDDASLAMMRYNYFQYIQFCCRTVCCAGVMCTKKIAPVMERPYNNLHMLRTIHTCHMQYSTNGAFKDTSAADLHRLSAAHEQNYALHPSINEEEVAGFQHTGASSRYEHVFCSDAQAPAFHIHVSPHNTDTASSVCTRCIGVGNDQLKYHNWLAWMSVII